MIRDNNQTILVVNDVEPTRKGIEVLLTRDGYRIETARNESDATGMAHFRPPDLMLVSLEGEVEDVIKSARRIREKSLLNENVPIIIFCGGELEKDNEIVVEPNIYLAYPDNFNHLRGFINRLLREIQKPPQI